MPKKPTTHVLMVVDMSGSMSSLAADVRGGFNTYVTDLADQTDVKLRLTAVVFDDRYELLCTDAKLAAVPRLDTANYRPRGMTALLDAVGKTITGFDDRVPVLPDGDRVICVVQTDGHENASCEYTWDTVSRLITDRQKAGVWSFAYLGAGVDTWSQASAMGFKASDYVGTHATSAGTSASYSGLTRGVIATARGAGVGAVTGAVRDEPGAAK